MANHSADAPASIGNIMISAPLTISPRATDTINAAPGFMIAWK